MRKTQLVELDLRSGIVTNDSPYRIGPRLRYAENAIWDYRWPRSVNGSASPWMMRQPLTFDTTEALTVFDGASAFRDIGFSANGSITDEGVLLIGMNTGNQYAVWNTDGTALTFDTGVTRFTTTSAFLGCSAWWRNPGFDPNLGTPTSEGIAVFSHLTGNHIYYLLDGAGVIRSLTTDVTNCHAGASAFAVHLDRLWLLGGIGSPSGVLRYTDPFDITSIRSTNEILVLESGRCLIAGQFGAIDTSGVPHLIIGCSNGIQVLDGDPQLGGGTQASLRTLGEGVGILGAHMAAGTPYGVYFLGSDGDVWRIPPGCQVMVPLESPIRDVLGYNSAGSAIDFGTGSIVWFAPYLYIFPGGQIAQRYYIAEPSPDGIKAWWGPVSGNSAVSSRTAVVRGPLTNFATHAPSGFSVPSLYAVDMEAVGSSAFVSQFDTRTAAVNTGRATKVITGLINVPGHRVQVQHVILETVKVPQVSGADVAWTVTVGDEHGTSVTAVRTPESVPAAGTYNTHDIQTLHFAIPPLPAARGMFVQIAATSGSDLALIRAFAEIHTSPTQF